MITTVKKIEHQLIYNEFIIPACNSYKLKTWGLNVANNDKRLLIACHCGMQSSGMHLVKRRISAKHLGGSNTWLWHWKDRCLGPNYLRAKVSVLGWTDENNQITVMYCIYSIYMFKKNTDSPSATLSLVILLQVLTWLKDNWVLFKLCVRGAAAVLLYGSKAHNCRHTAGKPRP